MEYIKAPFNRIHTGTGTTLYLLQYDRQYDHVRKFKYYYYSKVVLYINILD